MLTKLIESLQDPSQFPHPCETFKVIETHISWLILTGHYAYKIKKPVNFGFLDFTTLEQRRFCCEEELRLNQRLSPDIYLELVPISGTHDNPLLGDDSAPIEYAVKMNQFDPRQRLDQMLKRNLFEARWIDMLAEQIADFHQRIPIVALNSPWGEPEAIWDAVSENYQHICKVIEDPDTITLLQRLLQTTAQNFRALEKMIRKRKRSGHVRECHGDLHLANITLFHDELRLFDCIEFNLQFRWIDTLSDLSFLLMDLEANNQPRWANRFLNRYLELTGDYDGISLLRFYKSYRSMVRAKVAVLGPQHDLETFNHYLKLTAHFHKQSPPVLFLMHGVSGSGKSYLSEKLVEAIGAIRIRSDNERKRLHRELSLNGEDLELYGADMNTRTLHHLQDTTKLLLRSGQTVIVDATLIRQRTRTGYIKLAEQLNVPVRIISCSCQQHLIEARLALRNAEGKDPSDADVTVMLQQLSSQQPLTASEQMLTLHVDTQDDEAIDQLLSQLRAQNLVEI